MIFAGFICLQNRNLKALIRHAFRGPDQVDVWDQVHLYALWNEQTGNSELLKPPLVRKGRRFFDGEIIMNNYLYDRGFKILLPHWETIQKESRTDDECHKRECPDKGSKIISIGGTLCTDAAEDGRCALNTPFINTAATGQNINRLRAAAGLTVRDMQMIFGFTTPQAIYKWIHGTALPTIDNLVILADVLDVTMDEIIVVSRTAAKSG